MTIFKIKRISPNGLGLQVAEVLNGSRVNCQRSQAMYALITTIYCSGSDVCSIYRPLA